MRIKTSILAACLAFGLTATPAQAWVLLGSRDVADRTDHDVINLPGDRRFDHIKLCVQRKPVHFYDLDVFYRNGGHQPVSIASRINPGGCTRAIDLNGAERNIDRISMVYESIAPWHRRTAQVNVFGE